MDDTSLITSVNTWHWTGTLAGYIPQTRESGLIDGACTA